MRLTTAGGGPRFHVDLYRVGGCVPVLFEACAETLAADTSVGE